MYTVYVLTSLKDGKHYRGYTSDIKRRLKEHNAGKTAPYPSGKGEVCKTFMQRFESARRLKRIKNEDLRIQNMLFPENEENKM